MHLPQLSAGDFESWPERWLAALQARFARQWRGLARHAGDGIRALLNSPADLQQAAEIVNLGLLAGRPVEAKTLSKTGAQFLAFAVGDLEAAGRDADGT